MKNFQMIDDAINARYSIYTVSDEEFALIFPGEGQDIEFIEDIFDRLESEAARELMDPIWGCGHADKNTANGIHGTLFCGLQEKQKFYENRREPVNDWKLMD